jgi:hypothetical protein
MKFALALSLLVSVPAFAHVEDGRYVGKTPDGKACEMTATGMSFENGMHHPLNERVSITVDGVAFSLRHPPVIDAATAKAFFNHDMFQGIVATPEGAKALQVDMIHTPKKEGPGSFTYIVNKWKTGEKTSVVCQNIELVP